MRNDDFGWINCWSSALHLVSRAVKDRKIAFFCTETLDCLHQRACFCIEPRAALAVVIGDTISARRPDGRVIRYPNAIKIRDVADAGNTDRFHQWESAANCFNRRNCSHDSVRGILRRWL